MDKFISNKIRAISFFLMIMVVYIHSKNRENVNYGANGNPIIQQLNYFVQNFLSEGIARVAVPLFFLISGYLFFMKIKEADLKSFFFKIKKRFRTLVLPYLFWSLFGLLIFLVLQSFPFAEKFFNNQLIINYSWEQLLSTIFINPIPYQLWFIRDLFILVLLSPIIYWLVKFFHFPLVIILALTWFINLDYIIFSNEALLFFALGCLINIKEVKIEKEFANGLNWFFMLGWLSIVLVKTVLWQAEFNSSFLNYIHKISILIGCFAVWGSYNLFIKDKKISGTEVFPFFQYGFFLYVFHEPALTIFKKLMFWLIGKNELSSLITYIFAPLFTIIFAFLTAHILKRTVPKFYNVITGGR